MPRAGLSRDRVIAAAAALVDSAGPQALSLAQLAAELGVRTPSLYKHVGGLDDVVDGVAAKATEALAARLEAAALGRATDDAVRAVAHAYRQFGLHKPHLHAVLPPSPVGRSPEVHAASDRVLRVLFAVFSGYGLSGDDLVHVARAFRAAVRGFVDLESTGGFGLDADPEESFRFLVDTLIAGIPTRPTRSLDPGGFRRGLLASTPGAD